MAVELFTQQPAYRVWANALDGLATARAKKMPIKEKIGLIALPILLSAAAVAATTGTLPLVVPVVLGAGALSSLAYSVYRFYQNRTTRTERALIAFATGNYKMASALFKSLLKPEFATLKENQGVLPHCFHSSQRDGFNFPHIRARHDYKLFSQLYGSTQLFRLQEEMSTETRPKAEEVAERLAQANLWMRHAWGNIAPWQVELAKEIREAAQKGLKMDKGPFSPALDKAGKVALLGALDRLQHCVPSGWEGIYHTKRYLRTLRTFITPQSVGMPAYRFYRDLLACETLGAMIAKANAFPKDEIEKLEKASTVNQ